MSFFQFFVTLNIIVLCLSPNINDAIKINNRKIEGNFPTIYVDPSGKGNFTRIQAAVDSVPSYNKNWICIHVKAGTYREKIRIPYDRPLIYLQGEGQKRTSVTWGDHDSIETSSTFTAFADNIVVKGITFLNSYNQPPGRSGNPMKTACAGNLQGDKYVFLDCGFIGFQDTLWDERGRHYFKSCIIQGAVDFIFGSGQSIYEGSIISVVAGALNGVPGYITAQGRSSPNEANGFVFKSCNIMGDGKTYLGRPWRNYARVVFTESVISGIVIPEGWDPWFSVGHENQLTYAEHNCRGPGSDLSRRVKWANTLNPVMLRKLTSMSFIDNEGWIKPWMLA